MKTAIVTLESCSPYSQSRYHETPKLDKESPNAWEERTWRNRLHVDDHGIVFIPPMAFKNSVCEAAKYLPKKIQGSGNATYTKHIESGLIVDTALSLGIRAEDVQGEWLFMDAKGKPGVGSGTRVKRCYPVIHKWSGEVTYNIGDETVTEEVFRDTLENAGQFIGIGRFRPRNRGFYGRYIIKKLKWL